MSSVERMPTSVEVGAVVVETSAQKSAASKEWNQTLSHDAERKARAVKRSETFKEAQRFFHDIHGEGSIVSRSADGIVVMEFDNGEDCMPHLGVNLGVTCHSPDSLMSDVTESKLGPASRLKYEMNE